MDPMTVKLAGTNARHEQKDSSFGIGSVPAWKASDTDEHLIEQKYHQDDLSFGLRVCQHLR
jgi:hypothetical protein